MGHDRHRGSLKRSAEAIAPDAVLPEALMTKGQEETREGGSEAVAGVAAVGMPATARGLLGVLGFDLIDQLRPLRVLIKALL